MNTARWRWETSLSAKDIEDCRAQAHAANERAKKLYSGPSESGFEFVLERDGMRRGRGGYADIPWEALVGAGLEEVALRTYLS